MSTRLVCFIPTQEEIELTTACNWSDEWCAYDSNFDAAYEDGHFTTKSPWGTGNDEVVALYYYFNDKEDEWAKSIERPSAEYWPWRNKTCAHCDGSGREPIETSEYPPEPCSVCGPAARRPERDREADYWLSRVGL